MDWAILILSIRLGYMPLESTAMYQLQDQYYFSNNFNVEHSAELVLFDHVFFRGSMKNYFVGPNVTYNSFTPINDEYNFGCGLKWDNIEIGLKAFCTHPVRPWAEYRVEIDPTIWERSYREFYVKAKVQIGGK